MRKQQIEDLVGITASISNAHTPAPSGEFHTFEGDLCQMSKAANVARNLGMKVGYAGGLPYVQSKEDYDKVVQYIIEHKVEGYWHYTKG
ncbi:MAG: hypothetical protein IJE59_03435 [Clostridia bacterium]|nr:hypothetical protein [Clostridia bacterium]